MQEMIGTWAIRGTVTTSVGVAITAVQYAASSTNTAVVLGYSVSQSGSTTSAMDQIKLLRKTAGATVTLGAVGTNVFDFTGNATSGAGTFRGTLSTSGTGVVASAEGTDGDVILQDNFNVLGGFTFTAQPNARIWVPVSGIIALKLKSVVALTYDVTLIISES